MIVIGVETLLPSLAIGDIWRPKRSLDLEADEVRLRGNANRSARLDVRTTQKAFSTFALNAPGFAAVPGAGVAPHASLANRAIEFEDITILLVRAKRPVGIQR